MVLFLNRFFSVRTAKSLLWGFAVCALLLFIGVLIPGPWRDSIEGQLVPSYVPLSSLAHVVLFALMAGLLSHPPLAWSVRRVVAIALLLAVCSEALQHFAVGRHPSLRDVFIDMVGAGGGVWFVRRTFS